MQTSISVHQFQSVFFSAILSCLMIRQVCKSKGLTLYNWKCFQCLCQQLQTIQHRKRSRGIIKMSIVHSIRYQKICSVIREMTHEINKSVTCMAAFVHHEDIRPNADHSTDITLEFSIWQPGGSGLHGFRIGELPVASDSLRSLLWTSFLYPLPSFIFSTATWVFITVQLHFNGVGYRGRGASGKKALN